MLELAALLATAVLEMAAVLGAAAFPSTFDGSTNAHVVPPASLRTRRSNLDDPATTNADLVAPPTVLVVGMEKTDGKGVNESQGEGFLVHSETSHRGSEQPNLWSVPLTRFMV